MYADEQLTGVVILQIEGEFDMAATPSLREAILGAAASAGAVVVDLSDSPFLDSVAMRALLDLADVLGERGVAAILVAPPEPSARRRLLSMAGVEFALLILDSEQEALDTLSVDEDEPLPVRRLRMRAGEASSRAA